MNQEIEVKPHTAQAVENVNNYPAEKNVGGLDHVEHGDIVKERDLRADAIEAENAEHAMTVMEAVRAYPMACFWAFVMSFCIVSLSLRKLGKADRQIMESYDVFLMNNFVALPEFKNRFGILDNAGNKVIATKWQSALQMSGQLGALIGVFLAGPLTSKLGYRWSTLIGLMSLNGFIFIMFFANSLPVFFVSQLTMGIPWGIFIANVSDFLLGGRGRS